MKITQDIQNHKAPAITTDASLDEYRDKNLFPEKLAKANEMLKTAKLPTKKLRN